MLCYVLLYLVKKEFNNIQGMLEYKDLVNFICQIRILGYIYILDFEIYVLNAVPIIHIFEIVPYMYCSKYDCIDLSNFC
mgnify:CR=1 FL=1